MPYLYFNDQGFCQEFDIPQNLKSCNQVGTTTNLKINGQSGKDFALTNGGKFTDFYNANNALVATFVVALGFKFIRNKF